MRDLILGVVLGIWITMIQTWFERHEMFSAFDVVFYLLTLALIGLLAWRPIILPIIAKVSPELWLKLSDWNRAVDYEKTKALVAERKAKREGKNNASNNPKPTDRHKV